MVRESDISYLAGLFDGEGSIYYKQTNLEKEFSDKISDLKERDISNKKILLNSGNDAIVDVEIIEKIWKKYLKINS